MRIKEFFKRNHCKRILAIVLLLGCVLPMLPADVFANWRITPTTAEEVEQGAKNHSIAYYSFAENMYGNVDLESFNEYYAFDDTKPDYIGVKVDDPATIATTAEKETTVTDADGAAMSNPYCTQQGWRCSYKTDTCTANFSFSVPEFTLADGIATTLDAPSWDYNIFTTNTAATSIAETRTTSNLNIVKDIPIGDPTQTEIDGIEYKRTVTAWVTIVACTEEFSAQTSSTSQTSHKCSSLFSNDGTAHTCTATSATCVLTYTYRVYIDVEYQPLELVKEGNSNLTTNDESAFTVSKLSVGDSVTAPKKDQLITTITDPELQQYVGYVIGYYTKNSDGTYEPLSFPYTIEESVTYQADGTPTPIQIWVKWSTVYPPEPIFDQYRKQDLNASFAPNGTNDVFNVSAGSATSTTIAGDSAFHEDVFYLFSDIESGDTLNLCMNDGRTDVNAREGIEPVIVENSVVDLKNSDGTYAYTTPLTDATASLDNNTRDYTVKLANDITVNSSAYLYLGGYTGNYSNGSAGPTGYIVDNYVALDLNGHTLYVDGTLHSFGYIYDSVGTGKIVVRPTGKVYTQLLIYGLSGLQHTLKSYGMGYSPFEDYNLPYMQTTVEIQTESTNSSGTVTTKSGTLVGYSMLYLHPDIGMMNYYMPVFGPSDALFSIKPDVTPASGKTTKGTVRITTMNTDLKGNTNTSSEAATANIEAQLVNVKNVFTFHDVYINFQAPQIVLKDTLSVSGVNAEIDTVLDLARVNFPISPMTDVILVDSVFELQQQIIVMPGATLTLDSNSVLKMSYYKESGKAAQKAFQDVKGSVNILITTASVYYCAAVSKYLSAGIFAPSYNVQRGQVSFNTNKSGMVYGTTFGRFWNYYNSSNVNIFGTIEFEGGNNADYVLSGSINLTDFKLSNMEQAAAWNAESLQAADFAGANVKMRTYGAFGAIANSSTGNVGGGTIMGKGSGYQIAKIRHYYALPLTSDGISYLYDESMSTPIVGSFNYTNGIFTSEDGATYAILSGATLPAYGDSPTEKTIGKDLITFNPSFIAVTVCKDTAGRNAKFVTDANGNQYVFYAGTYNATSGVDTANIVSGTTTCSIDGLLFYSGGLAKTLKWNGSLWVVS